VDSRQFDRLTKTLARTRSRRGLLATLAGGVVALASTRQIEAQGTGAGAFCGGIAALPCPDGFICVGDPGDSCDPASGGADCGGVCVPFDGAPDDPFGGNPCAAILCIEGTTCCPECGGICIPADIPCSADLCVSEPCNRAVCGPGEYCCNESCSRCVGLGQGCTRELCLPGMPGGEPCGNTVCGPDEWCCNASCSICAGFDEGCPEMFCEPTDPVGVRCGPNVCPPGQVCCNESCGICTPPDGVCIMIACVD
jgi:hypothetical protein